MEGFQLAGDPGEFGKLPRASISSQAPTRTLALNIVGVAGGYRLLVGGGVICVFLAEIKILFRQPPNLIL